MSVIGGRGGRNDDWTSPHARARAKAAERLDSPLDAEEATWLEDHLASCAACSAVASDYGAQRLELRALRERPPVPPRDLWARTAAAIEGESRHRSPVTRQRSRASAFRPYALLAGALVVAIAVGTLTSSQWFLGDATATPGATDQIAVSSPTPALAAPTPFAVGPLDVAYLSRDQDGSYAITQGRIKEVCPAGATDCTPEQLTESHKDIGPLASPETVFGSKTGGPLVVVGDSAEGTSLYVVVVEEPDPSREPTGSPDATPSEEPDPSTVSPSDDPTSTATPTPIESSVPPSEEPSPTPSEPTTGTVEIASGLEVLNTTAAYAPDGSAFAFTAQLADGSTGPDIYVWTVGDDAARAVTTDHKSVFGSWSGDDIVGSRLDASADGTSADPTAIVIRGEDAPVALPGAGLAWRPAVDPSGENAVYWAGALTQSADGTTWQAEDGRLVVGRWGDLAAPDPSASTVTPDASEQAEDRNETTIVEGPLTDWDVRWDDSGTRLAVWVADPDDPSVGKLSLYEVDPFDGMIDLENPPLQDEPALAGFSLDDGSLAWASPPSESDDEGSVLILAWTDESFGQVESAPGDFILVR